MVAATAGWFAFGERLGLADLAGGVLIAVALVLVARAKVADAPATPQMDAEELK